MRILYFIIFLSMGFLAHAQKNKNEIQISLSGVYHFDETAFENSNMIITRNTKLPTISILYGRSLKDSFKIIAKYGFHRFKYENRQNEYVTGELIWRYYYLINLRLSKSIKIGNHFRLEPYGGIAYRFLGDEAITKAFIFHPWPEGFLEIRRMNHIGVSFGTQLKARIFKRFNIGAEADYTRYWSKYTQNQFMSSVFIGYEF